MKQKTYSISIGLKQLGVASLYLLFGMLIHHYIIDNGIVSILWPGSGLALAAVLVGGKRYLWGILLGALVLNVLSSDSLWMIVGFTLANVLEAYLGAWLLTRNAPPAFHLSSLTNYLRLIGLGGAVASISGALIGALSLLLAGFVSPANYFATAFHWWMGDTLGVVLLAPFALAWWQTKSTQQYTNKQALETLLLIMATFFIGQIVFHGWLNEYLSNIYTSYFVFILVAWVAIRLDVRWLTLVVLMIASQALMGAYLGVGTFNQEISSASLQNYWDLMLILSGVGVSLSMYVNEAKQKELKLQASEARLKEAQHVSQLGNWELNLITNELVWSDEIFILFEIDKNIFPASYEGFIHTIHPEDRGAVNQAYTNSLKTHAPYEITHRLLMDDGRIKWVTERCSSYFNDAGKPTRSVGTVQDVTERKLAENMHRENQAHLIHMLKTSPIAVRIATSAGRKVLFANKRYAQLINTAPDQMAGKDPKQYYAHPQDYEDILNQLSQGVTVTDQLIELLIPGGTTTWAMASYMLINYENEPAVLGWFYDITNLRAAQEALQVSEHQAKQSLEELKYQKFALDKHAIVAVTDVQGRITYANDKFCEISGYSQEELMGQDHAILNSGNQPKGFFKDMYHTVASGKTWHAEVCNRAKDGHLYWVDTTIAPFMGSDGKPQSYISIRTDITQRKLAEEKSNYLAFYDVLTRLPNRRLFVDRLTQALATSARSGRDGALLFLDLDHFKTLNDTLGHDIGDLLLQQVAQRLTSAVREDDSVARIGGDEFVVLLENLSEHAVEAATQVETISEKILASLNQPYQLAAYEYHSTPSIGIALFSDQEHTQEDLLKHADIAMYQAKKAGRNTISFFDPHMQDAINNRASIERELRKALELQQFQLHYQIQVDHVGQPIGAEALIRWHHPERGMISPFNFIPLAEETGLILPIGQWVLETACAQLKHWQQYPLTRELVLAVNVSPKQFLQTSFVAQVLNTIQRHDIDPTRLKLELTESILVDNIKDIITTMTALGETGIRFSLDDFGTGYSSLQYLKKLPLNQLKIDQSFVRDIATDSSDRAIVLTIITMAHSLGLDVIAEGVETEEQRTLLLESGCRHFQGYLFSKPVSIDAFETLLITG